MPIQAYEIRVCTSCGLRYPLPYGHDVSMGQSSGTRCPICMGETRLILSRELVTDAKPTHPSGTSKSNKRSVVKEQIPGIGFREGGGVSSVLLDNIRSALNVGSIFRSADGFGFRHAYLCGITPTPENETVTKTSLGAEDSVPWSYHKDAVKLVKGLKKEGWKILALEDDERAVSIKDKARKASNSVLIVGNEITGVDPELLGLCDQILYIPMRGEKKSFNVAVAFGIAAFTMNG